MNKDEIIAMAREAGFILADNATDEAVQCYARFAAMAMAAEREAFEYHKVNQRMAGMLTSIAAARHQGADDVSLVVIRNATLYHGDCLDVMAGLPDASVDLTVTSPPYDNLRTYNGTLNDWTPEKWQAIIRELFRVTKQGGVVVWVVSDATINGSETGTSFRQALYAMECGFNLHDTMIWAKPTFSAVGALRTRYAQIFEYMFVFSKGPVSTFNPIKDRPNKSFGQIRKGPTIRGADGKMIKNKDAEIRQFGQRFNVWEVATVSQKGDTAHPAPFPEALARDHIVSWSNPGDVVFDPFLGSGTTGKMALLEGRRFIGIEREANYFAIACRRVNDAMPQGEGSETGKEPC